MPYAPPMDHVAGALELRCEGCEELAPALFAMPRESRSLRHLAGAARAIVDGIDGDDQPPRCNLCGGRLQASETARYVFEEPDAPAVTIDLQSGEISVDGEAIDSEEDMVASVGRPFSPADLHRLKLTALREGTCAYGVGPGLITTASGVDKVDFVDDPDGPSQVGIAGMQERMASLFDAARDAGGPSSVMDELTAGAWGVVPWILDMREQIEIWLGEPAQRMGSGQLLVFTLFDRQRAAEDLEQELELRDLSWEGESDAEERRDGWIVDPVEPTRRMGFNVQEIGSRAVEQGLTLREAARAVVWDHDRVMQCARALHAAMDADGVPVTWEPDLRCELGGDEPQGQIRRADVGQLARHLNFEPDEVVSRLRMLQSAELVGDDEQAAPKRPCGCEPRALAVLRPQGWSARRYDSTEFAMISQPFHDAELVLAEDCPHFVTYAARSTTEQIDVDEAFEQARADLKHIEWEVYARPLAGPGQPVLCAGTNIASATWDVRSLRGMANAVKVKSEQLVAVALGTNVVLLMRPGVAPDETLRLQVTRTMQDLRDRPFGDSDPVPPFAVPFRVKGVKAGIWTAYDL